MGNNGHDKDGGLFACEHLQQALAAGMDWLANECLEGRAFYCPACGVVLCRVCWDEEGHGCESA
jgi:hypothetical protein